MIKLDAVSVALTVSALLCSVYLSLWAAERDIVLFPAILLVSGLFLVIVSGRRIEHDVDISQPEAKEMFIYTCAAMAGILLSAFAGAIAVPASRAMALTKIDQVVFAVLLAVAEEMFFRGGVLSFLNAYLRSDVLSTLANAAIFTVYHLAVYQAPSALIFVFGSGLVLAYVTLRSGRLTPAMLAHVLNNLVASM